MKVRTGAKLNFELETGVHASINNENNPYDGATKNDFASMQEVMNLQVCDLSSYCINRVIAVPT
jgi:hypothetical protein